ncbi:MAG: lipoyl(octanoyl) transferase LipB [bacterium]|nr:lipoyl(octanoyl) transferase LipB [bacterium]
MVTVAQDKMLGWVLQAGTIDYERALEWQHGLVKMRQQGLARDTLMLLEHPPVITVGRDGHDANFKDSNITPYFIERGGDVTFHGPGQLVVYFVFNLTRRGRDLHKFMDDVQEGIIRALAEYGIKAERGVENTGVWVGKKKIASIGIAVKHWITYHGAAINLNTKLTEFNKINPCGLNAKVMTSAKRLLKKPVEMEQFRRVLLDKYGEVFGTDFSPIDLESLAEELESQSGGYEI